MKFIIASVLAIGLFSTASFAASDCNPAVGNWVNAAPTTCRIQGSGGQSKASLASEPAGLGGCGVFGNPDCPSCGKEPKDT